MACCGSRFRRSEEGGARSEEPGARRKRRQAFPLLAPGSWLLAPLRQMADTQIIERTPDATTIRTGSNGQRTVLPNILPILPIRNIVVFPGTVMPLNVGRPKSKALLDEVMPGEKLVGVVTQKNGDVEDPEYADLYTVGVAAVILKLFKLPDGNQSIIVHGLTRFRLLGIDQTQPFATGRIEVLEDVLNPGPQLDALLASVRQ